MATKKSKLYQHNQETAVVSEPAVAYGRQHIIPNFVASDDYSLVKKAKMGIDTEVFYSLAEYVKISEKTLASVINLSPRTISNYRDQNKLLEPNYSEHLLKLISLFEKGAEYLGNINEFKQWLEKPFWNSTEKPSDFLNTSGGVDFVMSHLERLAQGYPI